VSSAAFTGKLMAVIGLGNVGSQVAYHLNLMGCPLVLIDNGLVEEANFGTQGFTKAHLGAPKVQARAAQLTALNPDGAIDAIAEDIAIVGPGYFTKCQALIGCLDNWYARSVLHEISWELGIPLIDCGLDGSGERFYGRVAVYNPRNEQACMFCTWDRETLKSIRSRDSGPRASCSQLAIGTKQVEADPTRMVSSMGGVIAGIQVIQTLKLVFNKRGAETRSRELLLDLTSNQLSDVPLERSPNCLFEHARWPVKRLNAMTSELTVQELFRLAIKNLGDEAELLLPRKHLARQLRCRGGHVHSRVDRIVETLTEQEAMCRCGKQLLPVGSDLLQQLDLEGSKPYGRKTWRELGLPDRDIITAHNGERAVHFIFS
jgi:molybdopterin/thiamine biosynthesis adenylyltransferase